MMSTETLCCPEAEGSTNCGQMGGQYCGQPVRQPGIEPKGTSLVAALPNETKKCAPATAASHKQPPAGRKGLCCLRPLARAMGLTPGGLEGRTTSDTRGNDLGLDHQDQSETSVAHLTTNNTQTKIH